MSSATPTRVLQELALGGHPIVTAKDYRKYMLDMNGSFSWDGTFYEMSGKSVGGGLMKMSATDKYPPKAD